MTSKDSDARTFFSNMHAHMILFSNNDCQRSIPSVWDGLKPSNWKVPWACLEKNITKEQKVARLAGMISEKALFQHSEQPQFATIVKMEQNNWGANNINSFFLSGQFGQRAGRTRRRRGHIHAAVDNRVGAVFEG